MLEYEKKVILTKEEYECILLNVMNESNVTEQENYYYDTDDMKMSRSNVTYRIRKKGNKYHATVKKHNYDGKECSLESSYEVLEAGRYFPNRDGAEMLELKGKLCTQRRELCLSEEIKIFLDMNVYLDRVDYELEIEYPKDKEQGAADMLLEIAEIIAGNGLIKSSSEFIERIGKGKRKSERFFDRLSEISDNKTTSALDDKFKICDDLEMDDFEDDENSCRSLKNCGCEKGVCYKLLAYEEELKEIENSSKNKGNQK